MSAVCNCEMRAAYVRRLLSRTLQASVPYPMFWPLCGRRVYVSHPCVHDSSRDVAFMCTTWKNKRGTIYKLFSRMCPAHAWVNRLGLESWLGFKQGASFNDVFNKCLPVCCRFYPSGAREACGPSKTESTEQQVER